MLRCGWCGVKNVIKYLYDLYVSNVNDANNNKKETTTTTTTTTKHFCSLPVPAVQIVGTAKRDVRRRKKTTRGWGRGKSEELLF